MAPIPYPVVLASRSVSIRPGLAFLSLAVSCGAHLVLPLESNRRVDCRGDVLLNGVLFDSHQGSAYPLSSISAVASTSRGLVGNGISCP